MLDKINIEVEKQRLILRAAQGGSNELFDPDILLSSESEDDKKGREAD